MATAARAKPKIQEGTRSDWTLAGRSLLLASSDFVCVSAGMLLGFRAWAMVNPTIPPMQKEMILAPFLTAAAFYVFGLYPGLGTNAIAQMKRAFQALTLVYLLITAAMYMAKERWSESRGGYLFGWAACLFLIPLGRVLISRFVMSQNNWGVPVVILGTGTSAKSLISSLQSNRSVGYRPIACFSEGAIFESECAGVPISGTLADVEGMVKVLGAQHAIVAIPGLSADELVCYMRNWSRLFPRILVVPNVAGLASLWTEPRDLGGVLALEVQHRLLDGWNRTIKRGLDTVLATLILLLAAPIIVIAAMAIKLKSPGRAFYTQARQGKDGKAIFIAKLRTMHVDAEQMLERHLGGDPDAAKEWSQFYKLKKDPRIIPGIGTFLRRSSIDELPQLWNVLKGEMSLVGPRPFPAYHNKQFDPEFLALRLQVMPGLTGLWQVWARSNGDLKVQEAIDSYYIRNWSLWLDVYILVRTVRAVLLPMGSY